MPLKNEQQPRLFLSRGFFLIKIVY